MLNKDQVLNILREGLDAFIEVTSGRKQHNDLDVCPRLGSWGYVERGECFVCMAGARYLKKNRKLILEAVKDKMAAGLPQQKAMAKVIGDAEIILDAMRLPYLAEANSPSLSGGMKVPGLFRELGIEIPPFSGKDYLTPEEVVERVRGILKLNELKEEEVPAAIVV